MKGHVGDRIILAANRTEGPVRDGEVIEVRGPNDGPPFLVRWSDGHTALVFPGPDAIVHAPDVDVHHRGGAAATPTPPVKQWQVQVSLFETGDETNATAVLFTDATDKLSATGHSRRSPSDTPAPRIGDEVAVARALRHLADSLLAAAEGDIGGATGREAYVRPV
jgi:hypothetical protein